MFVIFFSAVTMMVIELDNIVRGGESLGPHKGNGRWHHVV